MLYPKQGQYKEALEHILAILEPGWCPSHELCAGCEYEWEDAVRTAKAVLGKPVPRQKCPHCGALDQIWSQNDDLFTCDACKKPVTEKIWVEVPADKKED